MNRNKNSTEREEKFRELREKYKDKIPRHIGLTPDGKRRWSRREGVSTNVGHYRGYEVVKKILIACFNAGIKYLSYMPYLLKMLESGPLRSYNIFIKLLNLLLILLKRSLLLQMKK